MYVFCLLLLFFVGVFGQPNNRLQQVNFGEVEINILYSPNTGGNESFIVTRYDALNKKVYIVKFNEDFTIQNPTCKIRSFQSIIYGTYSCSNPNDPSTALISDYCEVTEIDAIARKALFKDVFYLDAESSECYLAGGNGDPRLCIGPLYFSNRDNTPNEPYPTPEEFMTIAMTYVRSLTGPLGMAPTVTELNVFRPQLNIQTDCGDFGGAYDSEFDIFTNSIQYRVFAQSTTVFRKFVLTRDPDNILKYNLDFSELQADGSLLPIWQTDTPIVLPADVTILDTNWFTNLNFNGTFEYKFSTFNESAGITNCTAVFNVTDALNPPQIQEVFQLTAANYSQNAIPERYNRNRICNYMVGRLDSNNLLFYPNCPELSLCGGYASYVYPESPFPKIFVPADPDVSFRLSCFEVHPKNETFEDLAGNKINREQFFAQTCFFPLINPERALDPTRTNEREIQCQKGGGYTIGRENLHCGRPMTLEYCLRDWYYWDQYCYSIFEPFEQRRFAGTVEEAAATCEEFFPGSEPLEQVDQDLLNWLLENYIYFSENEEVYALYRIPNFQTEGDSRCLCFDTETKTIDSFCPCYETQKDGKLIFPICRYAIKDPELQTKYFATDVPLQTAITITNGQEGPNTSGFEAECNCFPGFCGRDCTDLCCPESELIEQQINFFDPRSVFFRKCYANGQGQCYNNQPLICQCAPFFGPAAALDPQLSDMVQFNGTPCACPASGNKKFGPFQINDVIYPAQAVYNLPCSGIDRGVCLVDNSTNIGVCDCVDRLNLDSSRDVGYEPAFAGKNCGCDIPVPPYRGDVKNGPITTDICNARGTCCPFGQNFDNPFVGNLYDNVCYDVDGNPFDGCVCDNGFTGPSCTCPRSFDFAERKLIQPNENNFVFIDLDARRFIRNINISSCDGLFDTVQVANTLTDFVECNFNDTTEFYQCDTTIAHQFIYIFPSVFVNELSELEGCVIKAYEGEYFEACGEPRTVNPFSGAFFNLPTYRSPDLNIYPPTLNESNYGCTNTECMCAPEFGGFQCRNGVSDIRDGARLFCGQETLIPTTEDPTRGRGQISNEGCDCNPLSNFDPTGFTGIVRERFYGDACECSLVYNPDLDDVLPCAGNGVCQPVDIPYGVCEVDDEKYRSDALFNPFVTTIDNAQLSVEHVTQTNGFFTYPKVQTGAPTPSPTPGEAVSLYLFSLGLKQGDWITNYDDVVEECAAIAPSLCSQSFPFADLSYRPLDDLPDYYAFNSSIPIYSEYSILIANSWDQAVGSKTLNVDLATAGVITNSRNWFSGYDGDNCNDFTTSIGIFNTELGGYQYTNSLWIKNTLTLGQCNNNHNALCACTSEFTAAPTPSPTQNPTLPVELDKMIISVQDFIADGPADQALDWEYTLQNCVDVTPVDCDTGNFPFLTYNETYNMENILNSFSDTTVVGDSGVSIASSTVDMATSDLINSIGDAVQLFIDNPFTLVNYATGSLKLPTPTPTSAPLVNCDFWTSTSNSESYAFGDKGSTDATSWHTAATLLPCDVLTPTGSPSTILEATHLCYCIQDGTLAPTPSPTMFPTSAAPNTPSPTVPEDETIYAYMSTAGQVITFNRIQKNIDYNNYGNPLDVSITTTNDLVPINWENVVFRIYNYSTSVTDTGYMEECNPAQQAIPPGNTSNVEFCPFLDMCPSGVLCNDDLTPVMGEWSNIRGCICSYDIKFRGDIPAIPPGTYDENLRLAQLETISTNPDDLTLIFGQVDCASFIDRSVNCIFFNFGLPTQCNDEPIGCYDFTLGEFFGGFWTQHPTVKYNLPQEDWTEEHYRGIASIINFKHYENYVNPLSPDILTAYLNSWLGDDIESVIETIIVEPEDFTYQVDLVQARNVRNNYQYDPSGKPTLKQALCQAGDLPSCRNEGVANQTNEAFLRVGLEYRFQAVNVLSIEITPNHQVEYTGIEVLDQNGEVCGQVTNDEIDGNSTYVFTCIENSEANTTEFIVRYLGLASIYDAPEQTFVNFDAVPDPFISILPTLDTTADWMGDGEADTTILLNVPDYSYNVMAGDVLDIQKALPQQTFPQIITGFNKTLIDINTVYKVNTSTVIISDTELFNAWGNITNFILQRNVYPFNEPLANLSYPTRDIDYETDKDYLYNIWTTFLAPRRCSSDTNCQTFGLGECLLLDDSFTRPWLQGDQTRDSLIDAGGCLCNSTFESGYYSLPLACQTCEEGYGPATIKEFAEMVQYDSLITPILNVTVLQEQDVDYDYFKANVSCRYPSGRDPITASFIDINICAGHGRVQSFTKPEVSRTDNAWINNFGELLLPKCESLFVGTDKYDLFENITDINALIYTNELNETINIINGALYYNSSTLCTLETCEQTFPNPDICTYDCGNENIRLTCSNPDLWDENGFSYHHTVNGTTVYPVESNRNKFTYFYKNL